MVDLSHYHEHGFQVFRNVLPQDDVCEMRSWLEAQMAPLLDTLQEVVPRCRRDELGPVIAEFLRAGQHTGLSADVQNALSGHFPLAVRMADPFKRLLTAPKLMKIFDAFFPDEPVYAHMPPMARFVLPGNNMAGVPPHQDISYNKHMSEFFTVWTPLVEIDEQCGGVRVHAGSQDVPELLQDLDRRVWLDAVPDQGHTKVDCLMSPGDVLLFPQLTIHESIANVSDRIRLSIDYRVFGGSATSTKHHYNLRTRELIAPRTERVAA